MNRFNQEIKELRCLAKIAAPLTLSGLIEASIAFSSTFFLAHLGAEKLAAGALASWLFMTLMVILWGTFTAVSVLISKYHGAEDKAAISRTLIDALGLAVLISIPASLIIYNGAVILKWCGQPDFIVSTSQSYLHALAFGTLPDLVMLVLLQFTLGLQHMRVNLIFTLAWVPLNILLNYLFIFGKFGFPALDIAGIGWGTSASYWVMTIALFIFLLSKQHYRCHFSLKNLKKTRSKVLKLLHLGVPMGLMYASEILFFFIIALLMGRLNYLQLAAHQLVIQYFWQMSVLITCIAQAVTLRVSYNQGQATGTDSAKILSMGIILASVCLFAIGLFYWFFPDLLLSIDIKVNDPANAELVYFAKRFFMLCALFQILESVRFTAFGALRGINDTRFTLFASLFSFWGIALPTGYLLAFHVLHEGEGLWLGIIMASLVGMIILTRRFLKLQEASWRALLPIRKKHNLNP